MKKQLLAFLLSVAFVGLTYALEELDLSSDTFCENSPKAQVRAGLFYLPNQEDPYSGENLCIYTNGQYYNRGEIINGLKAGNWSWWHNNGQLDKTHVYRDGNLVSETAFKYFANGQQQIEQTFNFKYENDIKILLNAKLTLWKKDGKLERIQEFGSENVMNEVRFNYFDNDQLESKISFKDGKLEGSSFYWFENGNKKKELTLENEKRHGRYTEWYESGQIMHDGNYVQGELVGKASWWFESGQKSQEGSYNRDDSGFKLINWYENGQMKSMVTIVRGKPSGQYTKWSEEGQKKVEGFYQGHKKHGWHVEWFDNGQMLSEGDYKNNNKNDWWTTWHNNGNIATSGNYKNNLKDGWWVEWYENGRKALELNYIEGIEESIFLEIKKHKELAAIAAKEKEDVEKQLSAAKRKLKQLKAKIEEATKKKELLEAERIALQEKFEDEQNVRALITEIQAEADADRRQVLEDIFNELKENYIGLMASKVRKEWRFMGAEDYWGCYVHIIQSEVGDVLSVNIQNCTIDDSSKAKSFKDSIERAVYRASPLPLAPDQDLFNAEVLFHFRVN